MYTYSFFMLCVEVHVDRMQTNFYRTCATRQPPRGRHLAERDCLFHMFAFAHSSILSLQKRMPCR
jgi:hypothetical protein